jgi:hypothetical protein
MHVIITEWGGIKSRDKLLITEFCLIFEEAKEKLRYESQQTKPGERICQP